MTTPIKIEPLMDDVLERHPFWGKKHLGFVDLKDWYLHKSIKRQLKARPEVWGAGLWPDERLEAAAKKIAQIFEEEYGMPNRFIPDDPLRFIGGYRDDLEPCEVLMAIEDEFECKLPDELFDEDPDMTYRRFVEIVLSCQGNGPHKKKEPFTVWDGVQLGLLILFSLCFVVGMLLALWKTVWIIIGWFK